MRFTSTLLFILLTCASCAKLQLSNEGERPSSAAAKSSEYKMASFLWGFIPGRKLPVGSRLCDPNKFISAHLEMTTANVWLTVVTLGIYVPHRVTVRCAL